MMCLVKKRGRPTLPVDQRLTHRLNGRVTRAQRDKFERLGGWEWLRWAIGSAKPKKADEPL